MRSMIIIAAVAAMSTVAIAEEPKFTYFPEEYRYSALAPTSVTDEQLIFEVSEASLEYDVPIQVLWAVLYKETHWEHTYGDGRVKRGAAGEIGISQILPDGMTIKKSHDLWDRADNIRCCAELLRHGMDNTASLARALGWYNTGSYVNCKYSRAVMAWLEEHEDDFVEVFLD